MAPLPRFFRQSVEFPAEAQRSQRELQSSTVTARERPPSQFSKPLPHGRGTATEFRSHNLCVLCASAGNQSLSTNLQPATNTRNGFRRRHSIHEMCRDQWPFGVKDHCSQGDDPSSQLPLRFQSSILSTPQQGSATTHPAQISPELHQGEQACR